MSDYSEEEHRQVRDLAVDELIRTQSGYALKEFLMELYGTENIPFLQRLGAQIRTTYDAYYAREDMKQTNESKRACLVGLNEREARENWGQELAKLFGRYREPRFFFTPVQQQILTLKLAAHLFSDDRIARELDMEVSTLHHHWKEIFLRVADAGLIDGTLPFVSRDRRDSLLEYLRQHPEELRPIDRRYFGPSRQSPRRRPA
jgi:hypothetical protein